MRETKDLLDFEIYPNLDRAKALRDLDPRDKGKYYLLTCPQCGKREAYLYKTGIYIKCNRANKCDYSESLWDHIQGRGLTNQETLRELARLAHFTLPELSGYSEEKAERAREKANAFEIALEYFKERIWEEKGKEGLDYLRGRGYSEEEIKGMELGFYPSLKEFDEYIVNRVNHVSTITSLGLRVKGMGQTHKIVIPYRDPVGRLKGFIVRATKKAEPKYLFTAGVEKDTLFNLHEARGVSPLILTEGYLDTLILTQRGINGAVGIGGSTLSEAQADNALRYGVKSFILALDNDEAGRKGTEQTLELIARKGLKGYVITMPEGYKDPDELIKAQGIEAFKALLDRAESGARWMGNCLLSKQSKQSLRTDQGRDEAIREALAFEETLRDPIDSKDLLDVITGALNLAPELLEPKIRDYHEKNAREREESGYKALFREGSRILAEGRVADLRGLLDERLPELRAKAVGRIIAPYTLEKGLQEIRNIRPGLNTGYPSLDKFLTIPQEAMTIIVGRPSHGKTTLLLNLFLNMIKAYPEKAFFFFSYEQTTRQLWVRLITMLSGIEINPFQNYKQIENYLRGDDSRRSPVKNLEGAKAEFKKMVDTGRLWLLYEPLHVDELAETLAFLKARYDMGGVFIDYLQKVKVKGKHYSRQAEIQKVSEGILESALKLSLPIVLGAQFNREVKALEQMNEDKIREAGDIEQDANLILGLWNETENKEEEEKKPIKNNPVDLNIRILKNRDGVKNEIATLSLNRPILTITEKEK